MLLHDGMAILAFTLLLGSMGSTMSLCEHNCDQTTSGILLQRKRNKHELQANASLDEDVLSVGHHLVNISSLTSSEMGQFLNLVKLKSKRMRITPEAWKYVPDLGTCHSKIAALSDWQCREFCSLLHNFPSDCTSLQSGGNKCCDFIPNIESDFEIKGNLTLPRTIHQVDAGMANATAVQVFQALMAEVLGYGHSLSCTGSLDNTDFHFQVTFKDSSDSHMVQSAIEHLEKNPHGFVDTVLVHLGLAEADLVGCKHVTDACECVFKDNCSWTEGKCQADKPGPKCTYLSLEGELQGKAARNGYYSFEEAQELCSPASDCNGLSCFGQKCSLMESGTAHPKMSNATHGVLMETFTSLSGSHISDLTDSDKFTADKPDEVDIIRPSGGFEWLPSRGWYGARFTSVFKANSTGRHYFWLTGDDSAELWLDKRKVAESWSRESPIKYQAQQYVVDLDANQELHFQVLYKAWGGPNELRVFMVNAGPKKTPITVATDTAPVANITHKELGNGLTYDSARQACSADGRRLCHGQEICPKSDISKGPLGTAFSGDHWAPIGDSHNEWVEVGDIGGRTCMSHNAPVDGLATSGYYGAPPWGTSGSYAHKNHVYCCEVFDEESLSGDGSDYRGYQTLTRTGKTCQKWTSQSPQKHTRTPEAYPGKGLGDHNYCRNPDGEPGIWCYTTEPGSRWELCDPLEATTTQAAIDHKELGNGLTYDSARQACSADGRRLCRGEEICPKSDISNGPVGTAFSGDHWAPIGDSHNEWIEVGDSWDRTCWSHTAPVDGLSMSGYYGVAAWGTSGSYAHKNHVYCCETTTEATTTTSTTTHLAWHATEQLQIVRKSGCLECLDAYKKCTVTSDTSLCTPFVMELDTGLVRHPTESSQCLDMFTSSELGLWRCNGSPMQNFSKDGSKLCLKNRRGSLCITRAGLVIPDTRISLKNQYGLECLQCDKPWTRCSTTSHMEECTKFEKEGNSFIHESGQCLDMAGSSSWSLWGCNGGAFQTFKMKASKFCFQNRRGAQCLVDVNEVPAVAFGNTTYHQLPKGSHGCSPGSEITTEEECAHAMQSLNLPTLPNKEETSKWYPSYCSSFKGNEGMRFNENPDFSRGHKNYAPICKDKYESGLGPYVQLPEGSWGCQLGTEVETIEECEHAFASLGGTRGDQTWVGSDSRSPTLCSTDSDGKMRFNRGVKGHGDDSVKPICKSIPDLLAPAPVLLPWTHLTPQVTSKHYFKDCRVKLAATCEECDRQAGCPVSSLQEQLDSWCAQNTHYALARKVMSDWRCYADEGEADQALDFSRTGVCIDRCGYPATCPGGIGDSHRNYATRTDELIDVISQYQETPCQDTSHITSATNLDEVFGRLVNGEAEGPDPLIQASSMQEYLDALCSSLHNGREALARRLAGNGSNVVWACVSGPAAEGSIKGSCVNGCGEESRCEGPSEFSIVLEERPHLLLDALHSAMRRFCKTELGLVRETDVLATFTLGRIDVGALASSSEMQNLFQEAISAQLAEKLLVDASTITVFFDLNASKEAHSQAESAASVHPRTYQAEDAIIMGSGSAEGLQRGWNPGSCSNHDGIIDTVMPVATQEECVEALKNIRKDESDAKAAEYQAIRQKCDILRGRVLTQQADGYSCYLADDPKPEIKQSRFYQGFSGTGFVAFKHTKDDAIAWEIMIESNGSYTLDFKYSMNTAENWRGQRLLDLITENKNDASTAASALKSKDYLMIEGAAGCLACDHSWGSCSETSDPTACTLFDIDFDAKSIRPQSNSGQCIDMFSRTSFGLWGCHEASSYQAFEISGSKLCFDNNRGFNCVAKASIVNPSMTKKTVWFSSTGSWSTWEKLPVVVQLSKGLNRIMIKTNGNTREGGSEGPYLDSLTVRPFIFNTSWHCVGDLGTPTRLRADGEVEIMSSDGKHYLSGNCVDSLTNQSRNTAPLSCGEEHKAVHGWWNGGYESTAQFCYKARRSLQFLSQSHVVQGLPVKVIIAAGNPTKAWNTKRATQVLYGDEKLQAGIENEFRALPNIAEFSLGDVVMQGLLVDMGTKPTEPRLIRTAFKDATNNNTGALLDWPCPPETCEEPSGRHVEAWGIGPIPTFGGSFMHGEKAYYAIRGNEDLRWQLRTSLAAAQDWSFHLRASFESGRGGGAFVLYSEDGTKNYVEFDTWSDVAAKHIPGHDGSRRDTVFVSGPNFWSPPKFVSSAPPQAEELHDISIVKRDCTLYVYVDGKEALTQIAQYWKVVAVGLRPSQTNFRIVTFGMTGFGDVTKQSEWHPMCKMYLDKQQGFRLMRKNQHGCLKVVGEHSPVENTDDMRECTFFYFDEGVMKDASTGKCLDYYVASKTYGLWSCHGGWNQKFGPYRAQEGKYEFMRFCLSNFDCIDELDFGVCPKLQTACQCSEYPKVCGWDPYQQVCSQDFKDVGVACTSCDRQPKCAAAQVGEMQEIADAWCEQNTEGYEYARLAAGESYRHQRWSCYKLSGLSVDRDGLCMDSCGYPVSCGAGPLPHNVESVDLHDRIVNEVKLPNMNRVCDDPYRYSDKTCAALGWGPGDGAETVCASARGVLNREPCSDMLTFSDASAACQAIGARLCTEQEVHHGEAELAGCGLEKHHIWTKRGDCPSHQEWVSPADPTYQMEFPPRCQNVSSKSHYACCADAELPYIHVHPRDLAQRTPPTPLTVKSAVWQVKYETTSHEAMCLVISEAELVARKCKFGSTLFASRDGQLFPYEDNSNTPARIHLCLNATGERITTEPCTFGNGDPLVLTDDGKLFAGEASTTDSRCLKYMSDSTLSLVGLQLSSDETQCGQWVFTLEHHVATPTIPQSIVDAVERGEYDDTIAGDVVAASVEHAKEALGTSVSGAFWAWVESVEGLKMSLAATSFPIHSGTIKNLYRIWTYFGVDWDDKWTSLALAISYDGRHRNVLENDVGFDLHTQKLHTACGCETSEECGFPIHRGSNPDGGSFIEFFQNILQNGKELRVPLNEGTSGAPWPLLTYWSAVPHDECLYGEINGFGGEYTFRYERHEIMCAKSDWQPTSGPRISQDGGVCGRLSYLSRIGLSCAGAPSAGMSQPGHAAGWFFEKGDNGKWKWATTWSIYDERVTWTAWKFALTEDQWGQSMKKGHTAKSTGIDAQWIKSIAGALAADDGLRKYEKARIAAMAALQASYWGNAVKDTWLHLALGYNPQDPEIWELFRLRIDQGFYDLQGTLRLWNDFKQAMLFDAATSYHKLGESWFFTVAGQRTCSTEVIDWLIQETNSFFNEWKMKGFSFDYAAAETIFTFKQVECHLIVHGWNATLSHGKYGELMQNVMDDKLKGENLEGDPYGSGVGAVLSVTSSYMDSVSDATLLMEPLHWLSSFSRPALVDMLLFGISYFGWYQFERLDKSPSWEKITEGFVLPKLRQFGLSREAEELEAWGESCQAAPWKHTHSNSRNELYDGCYVGKNSKPENVKMFMDWIVPFYESGYKNDSLFPEQTLEWLRKSGAALLQFTNSSDMLDGTLAAECFANVTKGITENDPRCEYIMAVVQDDVESGRETEHEGTYNTGEYESSSPSPPANSNGDAGISRNQLPTRIQQKFQDAYKKLTHANSTPFDSFSD